MQTHKRHTGRKYTRQVYINATRDSYAALHCLFMTQASMFRAKYRRTKNPDDRKSWQSSMRAAKQCRDTRAYLDGYNTYFADRWQNPYRYNSQEFVDWNNGLRDARIEYSTLVR